MHPAGGGVAHVHRQPGRRWLGVGIRIQQASGRHPCWLMLLLLLLLLLCCSCLRVAQLQPGKLRSRQQVLERRQRFRWRWPSRQWRQQRLYVGHSGKLLVGGPLLQ